MAHSWKSTTFDSTEAVLDGLVGLQAKRWLSRGQPKCYDNLKPSIDRDSLENRARSEKLKLEHASIDLFRSTVRSFAGPAEQLALTDDIVALMVLRHYKVRTRLLDWSISPYVAAYFAVCGDDTEPGEIWSFDEPRYEKVGKAQWKKWPETTTDGSGDDTKFDAKLTAFLKEPPDWFIAAFYNSGGLSFPRQDAQHGAYSMTARFDRCHAEAIENLMEDDSRHRRYIIKGALKDNLRTSLREKHGVWRGSLFPDSAGAAETAGQVFPGRK